MSDNKNKKPKVFIKKNRDSNMNEKDEFYEYDKLKSRVDTVNEEFFENLESIDYEQEKLKNELQSESQNFDINEEITSDFVEENSEDFSIEDEIIQSSNFIDEDDDFGSIEDENKEIVSDDVEDSIFEKFDFINEEINQEKDSDNYKTLFENSENEDSNLEKDSFDTTGIIDRVNSNEQVENNLYSLFEEDDDDFGSIDSFEDEVQTDRTFFKSDDFVNVNQKANYYKENIEEDLDDEYYVDKKGRKKKKKSRLGSFFRFILLCLIAFGALAIYFGLTHDLFKIDYIQITGNVVNEKEILSAKMGVSVGDNIFLSRASKIEKNLKEIPTIESVKVTKNYPNIISVEVKENYVSSYINASGGITTIDNHGKVKTTSGENNGLTGIQLKGLSETSFKVGEAFSKDSSKVDFILEILNKSYYNNVASIDFSNDKDIIFELKNSIKVTFGDLKDYAKKLKVLDVLLKKIQTDGINASEIILNVGENPIIVKK